MFKYALVAVWSLGLGVLLRDVAQDWLDVERDQVIAACKAKLDAAERDVENAEVYAKALAHLYNGGSLIVGETTAISCKAREWVKS